MTRWQRFFYRRAYRQFLAALDHLQQGLFAFYLRIPVLPVRLIQTHLRLFRAMHVLRRYGSPSQILSLECLYETVFLLGQLRFRVTDKTQYDVCREEMQAIMQALSLILRQEKMAFHAFDQARDRFQTLFDGVLTVTARDPDAWEFFISHLDVFRQAAMRQTEGDGFNARV